MTQQTMAIQARLAELGYSPGPVDGIPGPRTMAAVHAFRKGRGGISIPRAYALLIKSLHHVEPRGKPRKSAATLDGTDISAWQGKVDWATLFDPKRGAQRFAILKTSEGDSVHRGAIGRFAAAREAAEAHDVAIGGYHFARPESHRSMGLEADAASEAAACLSVCDPRAGDLVPDIDLEAGVKDDDQWNAEWLLECCEVIEDRLKMLGLKVVGQDGDLVDPKCLIYTGRWAVNLYLSKAKASLLRELAKRPLHWAEYRPSRAKSPRKNAAPWSPGQIAIWQWTGHGKLSGVRGDVDRNRMLWPMNRLRMVMP